MIKFIIIGLGGSIGAVLRYELDNLIINATNTNFPWGTLGVNLIGCFVIGLSYKVFYYELLHNHFQKLIVTGFLGALTTFSSYSYATLMLFEKGNINLGLLNLLLNNVFGILFAYFGAQIAEKIISLFTNNTEEV